MFGFAPLDVAIGLILIFLTLSTLASVSLETLASAFWSQGKKYRQSCTCHAQQSERSEKKRFCFSELSTGSFAR